MSSAFYPQGMNSYNNRLPNGGYKSWKGSGDFENPVAITSGNIRPFTNKDYTNDSFAGFGLPRPIKHYRRGTTTISANGQQNRQVSSSAKGNMVSQLIDIPGGFVVKSGINSEEVCNNFRGNELVSDWSPIKNLTEKIQPGMMPCDKNNKPLCSQETKARMIARGSNTLIKKNYYTTCSDLLYSRCKTFDQNAFNFKSKVPDEDNTYYANCSNSSQPCVKEVVYKPSNQTFAKQGAVSSSTRILALQQKTLTETKKSYKPKVNICVPKINHKIYY